jgi:hypothetical protein
MRIRGLRKGRLESEPVPQVQFGGAQGAQIRRAKGERWRNNIGETKGQKGSSFAESKLSAQR